MTTSDLIQYYVQLLILQYFDKPKAVATVQTLVSAQVANQIVSQVGDGFTIDTAVGKQLTTLGKYVGAERTIFGISTTKTFFQLRDASAAPPPTTVYNGFADDSAPNTSWFWLQPSDLDSVEFVLTDGQMRNLIRYLVALEINDCTDEGIDNLFFEFFGTFVTWVDNFNMTMTVTHDATHDPNLLFEVVKFLAAFPRPAGVALTVVEI